MAVSTGSAGHAVALSAHATPMTTAAVHSRGGDVWLSTASATQTRPSTGGSVMPSASGKAITGEATASRLQRSASRRPDIRRARANSPTVATASQGRVSPASAVSPMARGSPNRAMAGR